MAGELDGLLAELENTRLAAIGRIKFWGGAVFAVAAVIALIVLAGGNGTGALVVLGIGAIVAVAISYKLAERAKRAFKQKVMPVLLKGIDPSLAYSVDNYVGQDVFVRSGLFSGPDRYSGKDLVEGKIGATAVRFSFVHAEEKYEEEVSDSEGGGHRETRWRTIFQGLLFVADFNKHFSGKTKIQPHGANFIDKLFGSHVELENPDFNKHFAVSSTDQVEARYILTPSLMEHFETLRTKFGTFWTSFTDEHLIMAIEMRPDAFEPSIRHSFAASDQVEKIVTKLKTATGIVTDLDLNTRIWTKQ